MAWSRDDYTNLDCVVDKNAPALTYQVDNYDDRKYRLVPKTWFSKNGTSYLRPPDNYKSNNAFCEKWTATIYERHYYPESTWIESKVGTLEMSSFRPIAAAKKFRDQIASGVDKNLITDSEKTPRNRKKKANDDFIYDANENNASGSSTYKSSIAKKSKNSQEDSRSATTRQPLSESILNVSDGAEKRDVYDPPIKIFQTQPTIISQQHQVSNENLFPNIDDMFSPALNTNPVPVAVSVFQLPATEAEHSLVEIGGAPTTAVVETPDPDTAHASHGTEAKNSEVQDDGDGQSNEDFIVPVSSEEVSIEKQLGQLPSHVRMPHTADVSDRQLLFEIRSEILKVKQLYTQLVDKLKEGNPAMRLNSVDILDFHYKNCDVIVKKLPCCHVQDLVDINTVLKDSSVAVSMVFVLIDKCKTMKSTNLFLHAIYRKLIAPALSESVKWKSKPSKDDNRQGISQMFELLSVIGVCGESYATEKNFEWDLSGLKEMIQDFRKLDAEEFRKENKLSKEQAVSNAKHAVPVFVPDKYLKDRDIFIELSSKVKDLLSRVKSFKIPG